MKYTVDGYFPTLTGVRYLLATDSDLDPAICVDELDSGKRTYRYCAPPSDMPDTILPEHRRRVARAILRHHSK